MKTIAIVFLLLLGEFAYSAVDSIHASSKITDVTVFFSGAQVTRKAPLKISRGKHILLIDKLPTDVNPQSIQVESIDGCTIHSVKYTILSHDVNSKESGETAIQAKIDSLELKCKVIRNKISVFDLEEKLMEDNSILVKGNGGTTVTAIREAADFYRLRLNEIRQSKLSLETDLDAATRIIRDLTARINKKSAESKKYYGQIMVTIDCDREINGTLKMSFYIPSAGWAPSYDFRVNDISKPLVIVYNANVFQTSGEAWENAAIRLATSNPNLGGNEPEMRPWVLGASNPVQPAAPQPVNEGQSQFRFEPLQGDAAGCKGKVIDAETHEIISFANVVVLKDHTQIANATTDFDGNFVIRPVPDGIYSLNVTFVGYEPCTISNIPAMAGQFTIQDIRLNASSLNLSEIEVVDYKLPRISKDQAASEFKISRNENLRGSGSSRILLEPQSFDLISNTLKTNVANLEYTIDVPYTIPSDGADYSIKIKEISLQVNYVYHVVPKLDPDAFLTAEIPGWNQLNLLPGKAGIYYHGTYTGETGIQSGQESDTLKVSLGRDKNILVKREGNKKLYDKKTIGNNVRETVAWDITLKNNKDNPIHVVLQDQFPLSYRKSIEVERLESSGAAIDDKTGKLTWTMDIDPGIKKVVSFSYSVKYPRYSNPGTE